MRGSQRPAGRLFHAAGEGTANARGLIVTVQVRGMRSNPAEADRSCELYYIENVHFFHVKLQRDFCPVLSSFIHNYSKPIPNSDQADRLLYSHPCNCTDASVDFSRSWPNFAEDEQFTY